MIESTVMLPTTVAWKPPLVMVVDVILKKFHSCEMWTVFVVVGVVVVVVVVVVVGCVVVVFVVVVVVVCFVEVVDGCGVVEVADNNNRTYCILNLPWQLSFMISNFD